MNIKKRAHVIIDENILREIDRLIGKKKRSSFIADAAKKELKKLNQLLLLKKLKGTWKDADHPDMQGKNGAYRWVRKLRDKDERLLKRKLG